MRTNFLSIITTLGFLILSSPSSALSVSGRLGTSAKGLARSASAPVTSKVGWQLSSIDSSDSTEPVLEFTKTKEDGSLDETKKIKAIDDDGILTLNVIQNKLMQRHASRIALKKASWSELRLRESTDYPKYRSEIVESLKRLSRFTSRQVKQLQRELRSLTERPLYINNAWNISQQDQKRILEINQLIELLVEENSYANTLRRYFNENENLSLDQLSGSLGLFLHKFSKQHAHEVFLKDGSTKFVKLFDSSSNNTLIKALTGRPLFINSDNVIVRENARVSIADGVLSPKVATTEAKPAKEVDTFVREEKVEKPEAPSTHNKREALNQNGDFWTDDYQISEDDET